MNDNKNSTRLETWDYASLSVVFILTCVTAVYHMFAARKTKNAREFLVSGKGLGIVPIVLSIVGTTVNPITIFGFPAEIYRNGVTFYFFIVSIWIGIPIGMFLYVSIIYDLGAISVFEVFVSALAIFAPAMALNQVTGLHLWTSTSVIGISCIIYTAVGGIKGVIWADAVQTIFILTSVIFIAVKQTIDVGGLSKMWSIAREGNRTEIFTSPGNENSNYSIWTILIGSTVSFLSFASVSQMFVQRYMLNNTLTKAQISYFGGIFLVSVNHSLTMFCGIILYARYHDCDPLAAGKVTSGDQFYVLMAFETLSAYKGLMGVFIAFILCATLSTLSSSINTMAAITMEDFIRPKTSRMKEATALRLSKLLVVAYGIACVAVVGLIQSYKGVVNVLFAVTGILNGPIFAVFTIGMLLPWVNNAGAIAAIVSGALLCGWACVGNLVTKPKMFSAPVSISGCGFNDSIALNMSWPMPLPRNIPEAPFYLYTLSSLWYPLWCLAIGIVAAGIVSVVTGIQDPANVDPKLIFPFMRKVIKNMKKSSNTSLKLNVDATEDPTFTKKCLIPHGSVNQEQSNKLLEQRDKNVKIDNTSC